MNHGITQSMNRKPLAWLLLLVLFAQVLFPLQIHVHHAASAATDEHEHVVDYHNKLILDFEELTAPVDTVELDADFYTAAKPIDNLLKFAVFFVFASVSLFALAAHFRRHCKSTPEPRPGCFQPHPPTRAPPR